MTTTRRDGAGTPFGLWLREHPDLDSRSKDLCAMDVDMAIHKFRYRDEKNNRHRGIDHLMLVEVKCFLKTPDFAQNDTMQVIDDLLRKATTRNGRRYPIKIRDRRPGRVNAPRSVRWLGFHTLILSGDRPDNSETILWDEKHHLTEEMLVEILDFLRDPDDPRKEFNTRRHHRRPAQEMHPDFLTRLEAAE